MMDAYLLKEYGDEAIQPLEEEADPEAAGHADEEPDQHD